MHLIPRLGLRKAGISRRPATTKLRLQTLEDRSLPSFGFGSAVGIGGTGDDNGKAVVLDAAGSMYVSGYFNNTVDFDPNGTNPTSNHVLSAAPNDGTAWGDGFVAKYSATGTFQWATDLGVGAAGAAAVQGANVYVPFVSQVVGSSGGYVSRLDASTGAVTWTTLMTATGSAYGVAVSLSGNLYADGSSAAPANQAIVDRLDPATGNVLWNRTSSGGHTGAIRLAVDSAGNAYATGTILGTTTFGTTSLSSEYANSADTFVWKLNANGSSVWAGEMGGLRTDPWGITTDSSGNAYVTGQWGGGVNNFNPGSGRAVSLTAAGEFIVKLIPGKNGAMQLGWAKGIGGNVGYAIAVDGSGNVYTTGSFGGTVNFNPNSGTVHNLSGGGIFVSKLDSNGNYIAAASMAGTADGNGAGTARGIALDGAGNVYTTGSFSGTADFDPTGGTYNLTSNGGNDIFVSVLTQTSPQLAVSRGPNVGVAPLTQSQLNAADAAAIREWAAAGLPAADLAKMKSVTADVTTLSGNWLGAAELNGSTIAIDATADGWDWSVNPNAKPAANRMDLLTVVEHELGHTIGLDSRFSGSTSDLMYAYLAPGDRRLPGPADVPTGANAITLMNATPRPSGEDRVDWLTAIATLKPKSNLYSDWLATA